MPSAQTAGGALTGRRDLLKLAAFLGVGLVAPAARAAMATPDPWSSDRRALIADIAETIIPATDTGGARAAGVPAFIEMMVTGWFDPAERAHFMEGMAAFDEGARAGHGKAFTELGQAARDDYYGKQLAAAGAAMAAPAAGAARPRTPFAALMKRLTVYGYYTSELGGSVELRLDMVPNEYRPDAPFKPGDRADSFILYSLSPFSAF